MWSTNTVMKNFLERFSFLRQNLKYVMVTTRGHYCCVCANQIAKITEALCKIMLEDLPKLVRAVYGVFRGTAAMLAEAMSSFVARFLCTINKRSSTLKQIVLLKDTLNHKHRSAGIFRLFTSTGLLNEQNTSGVNHLYLKDASEAGLHPDGEYPDWLWQLSRHKQTIDKLNPQSQTYRRLLRKKQRRDENERRKMKRF